MAVVKVSDYAIGDASLNDLMTSTDDQRRGFHQVSISNMGISATSKPEVKEGSVFDCNGALYEVTGDTSISGSPTGKTYIVFDESALTFSFSNTAPTWSYDKQGWYGTGATANDRYLHFIMDVTGAAYENKRSVLKPSAAVEFSLEKGSNTRTRLYFASDAFLDWIEATDFFVLSKGLYVDGDSTITGDIDIQGQYSSIRQAKTYSNSTSDAESSVITDLNAITPNFSSGYLICRAFWSSGTLGGTDIHSISKVSTTQYIITYEGGSKTLTNIGTAIGSALFIQY